MRAALGQGGRGLGVQAFVKQVAGAKVLGLSYFKLWAAGNYFDASHNGYYTWARFGFDTRLTALQKGQLTGAIQGAQTVNEVIERGGQAWWRRYGYDGEMWFDLKNTSAMMRTFRSYLAEKGLSLE